MFGINYRTLGSNIVPYYMVQSGRVCPGSEGKLALSFVRVIASEQKYLNLLPADFDFIKFKSQFGNKKKIKSEKLI